MLSGTGPLLLLQDHRAVQFCTFQHMPCLPVCQAIFKWGYAPVQACTYRLPALSNTAATFFALWVGEKSAEFLKGRLIWLSIFGGSVTLWQVRNVRIGRVDPGTP